MTKQMHLQLSQKKKKKKEKKKEKKRKEETDRVVNVLHSPDQLRIVFEF